MELNSIIVHLAFVIVNMLALSLLPLGRMILVVQWGDMKRLVLIGHVINFGLAWVFEYFWGLTTLVVLEIVLNGFVLFRVAKGNAALERGLRILTTEPN